MIAFGISVLALGIALYALQIALSWRRVCSKAFSEIENMLKELADDQDELAYELAEEQDIH
jgi:hypothetical protein